MPELPELEALRASLGALPGRTIAAVDVRTPTAVRTHRPRRFAELLAGRRFAQVDRAGKALLLRLSGGLVLAIHFKLWGLLRLRPKGETPGEDAALLLRLRDGSTLELRELQLSTVGLYTERELERVPYLAGLGPDPLSPVFTTARFRELVAGRAAVRAVLTDQERIAGIGNLWAHEILHAARLHPDRPGTSLTPSETAALHQAIRAVLREAIAQGGEPEFVDAAGRQGRARLAVYGRTGQRCPRSDGTIAATRSGGRPSFYCPGCQR